MKKQLTETQKNYLKKSIQKFQLSDGSIVAYCIINKDSKTGIQSNERLILMHGGQKSIRYYSKPPPGIPFTHQDQIVEGKQKVFTEQVDNFNLQPVKGKNSTVQMSWMKGKNKQSWIYAFGSPIMMNQWIACVQQMRKSILKLDNIPSERNISQKQSQISPINNLPQPSPVQYQAQTANQYKYGDVAEQIKQLRRENYPKFILNNQLSKKNLHENVIQDTFTQNKANQSNLNNNLPLTDNQNFLKKSTAKQQQIKPEAFHKKQNSVYNQSNNHHKDQSYQIYGDKKPEEYKTYGERNYLKKSSNILEQPGYKFNESPKDNFQQQKMQQNSFKQSNVHLQATDSFYGAEKNSSFQTDSYRNHDFETKPGINRTKSYQIPEKFHEIHHASGPLYTNNQVPSKKVEHVQQRKITNSRSVPPYKKWNQIWCSSQNPIQIYEEFIEETRMISQQIIDQLPFLKNQRKYIPIKYSTPYFTYLVEGISYKLHYFTEGKNIVQDNKHNEHAPLIFDQQSYEEAKRQFYNFNHLLSVTGNKTIFKVPLCSYHEYKGILVICKAMITDKFQKVQAYQYQKQIQLLEQTMKIRFIFDEICLYRHHFQKYLIFDSLEEFIPRIPNNMNPACYFRSQLLATNEEMIDDKSSIQGLNNKILNSAIPELISQLQSLQTWIISHSDLMKTLHRAGISLGCLTDIYENTTFIYLKKILVSEMVCQVFQDILRSQLNNAFAHFPADQFDDLNKQMIDQIMMDCAHVMINELFSYSSRSQGIWRVIVIQVKKKYQIVISKEDVIPGYLLGGVMERIGIRCNYKIVEFERDNTLFIKQDSIPRNLTLNFSIKTRRYDLESVSPLVQRVINIINSDPTPQNFEDLVVALNLKTDELPKYFDPIKNDILAYLCNFVPLGQHDQFQHLGLYDALEDEPHTFLSTKISLLAIKWSIKRKNEELGSRIFQLKFEENSFWAGQFNPAITQFYDFFSLYNASMGNNEESIKLAKSSLINTIKLLGTTALPTADKHYQLGNIMFKMAKKEDALKQYLRTKQILESHGQGAIPQYGVILLKLSILYLNFGKISQCVGTALQALKVFDSNGGTQEDQIQTYEILARAYEITRKNGDMVSVGALCLQKFNKTENIKIFQRMIKIVLLPKLINLNTQDSKKLLKIVIKMEQLDSQISALQAFSFLHFRSEEQVVMKKVINFIDNLSELYEDILRKDLFRSHRSLNNSTKMEAAEMLVYLEAISAIIGYNFIIGLLRENYT